LVVSACWGERIRTSDWLIQNQLPYRLATPQEVDSKKSKRQRVGGS
jgi:hypothetical protein